MLSGAVLRDLQVAVTIAMEHFRLRGWSFNEHAEDPIMPDLESDYGAFVQLVSDESEFVVMRVDLQHTLSVPRYVFMTTLVEDVKKAMKVSGVVFPARVDYSKGREELSKNLVLLIAIMYEQAKSTSAVIEICASHFGWLGWNAHEQGEKSNQAVEQSEEADDDTRRRQVTSLCEVLEAARPVLQQYKDKLTAEGSDLVIKKTLVDGALYGIGKILEEAQPYRL